MPNLETKLTEDGMLLRILAYGPAKTKKTWWAGKAAEANFNVILLDGDDGWQILKNIDVQFRKRISVIDLVDTHHKAIFCQAVTALLKDYKLAWDEGKKANAKFAQTEQTVYLDLTKLTQNDVLVIDSWTALTWSLMFQFAVENKLDMADAQKVEWEGYGWAGRAGTWMINQLHALPCHLIVIAHQTVYEKRAKDGKTIEYTRQQIQSTSGNHARTMPGQFSDILTFSQRGATYKIDTSGDWDRDGGSRIMPPKLYMWDELQFKDLILAAGNKLPDVTNRYVDLKEPFAKSNAGAVVGSGAVKPVEQKPENKPITGGTVQTTLKSLSGLKLQSKK